MLIDWIRTHREGLRAGFLFFILAAGFHWRSVIAPMTYAGSLSDELLVAWTIDWDVQYLLHPRGSFFDAPYFAPLRNTLAFTEHSLGVAAMMLPVAVLAQWPLLTLNVFAWVSSWLMAWSVWLLARAWGASFSGAVIGALIATFAPPRFFHAPAHPHVLALWWIPLGLLCWHQWQERGHTRWLLFLGGCIVGQGLMSAQGLLYFFVALSIAAAVGTPKGVRVRRWIALATIVIVALLILSPTLVPYFNLGRDTQVLWVPALHRELYAPALLDLVAPVWALPWLAGEYQVSAGLMPLMLLVGALLALRRGSRMDVHIRIVPLLISLLLCLVGVLLALGPDMRVVRDGASFPGFYAVLGHLPGFSGVRAVNRFITLTLLGIGLLVALQWRAFTGMWGRARHVAAGVLAALLIAEFAVSAPPVIAIDPALLVARPLDAWLAQLPASCIIAELPLKDMRTREEESALFLYHTRFHGKRVVNGYSGAAPQWYFRLEKEIYQGDIVTALEGLQERGADYLVVHPSLFGPLRGHAFLDGLLTHEGLELVTRFPDDYVFRFKGNTLSSCL